MVDAMKSPPMLTSPCGSAGGLLLGMRKVPSPLRPGVVLCPNVFAEGLYELPKILLDRGGSPAGVVEMLVR